MVYLTRSKPIQKIAKVKQISSGSHSDEKILQSDQGTDHTTNVVQRENSLPERQNVKYINLEAATAAEQARKANANSSGSKAKQSSRQRSDTNSEEEALALKLTEKKSDRNKKSNVQKSTIGILSGLDELGGGVNINQHFPDDTSDEDQDYGAFPEDLAGEISPKFSEQSDESEDDKPQDRLSKTNVLK